MDRAELTLLADLKQQGPFYFHSSKRSKKIPPNQASDALEVWEKLEEILFSSPSPHKVPSVLVRYGRVGTDT